MMLQATKTEFVELLSESLPWRERFLVFAVKQPDVLENLAAIRQEIKLDNIEIDRRLIANLARTGDLETAARLYDQIRPTYANAAQITSTGWSSAFAPFDWTFADEAQFRAQVAKTGGRLEFAVEPGNGGVLASRIIKMPEASFSVSIANNVKKLSVLNDLKLRLSCWGQDQPFFEAPFKTSKGMFDNLRAPPKCTYIKLAISARSWTGSSPLYGSLEPVIIKPK
jgi:hypothetical protein